MLKILSIGNSFSQDAHRYLSGVFKAAGVPVKNADLVIGGCSLERHFRNLRGNRANYEFEFAGLATGLYESLETVLLSDSWDVITLQQVSQLAPHFETYQPYLDELAKYVRYLCPKAELCMHQTWAYAADSRRLPNDAGFQTPEAMFASIEASYQKAAKAIGAVGIIPSGKAMLLLSDGGNRAVHRDGYHAGLGMGRLVLALTWLEALTGKNALENTFRSFDVPVTDEEIEAAKDAAHRANLD